MGESVSAHNTVVYISFLRYSLDEIGSGSHVHLSLSKNGENVFMPRSQSTEHGISKIGEEFMAGVLNHLPSILAFTAPVPNRFKTLVPAIDFLLPLLVYLLYACS